MTSRLYGPPQRLPPRIPAPELEVLETLANKKLVSDYTNEHLSAMSNLEANNDINPAMIDLQPEIQWFMRPFLLDYIVELHGSFRLQSQTLFRCFNIVDRYCARRIVFKRHYQLVGCTALWIAAKYEDKKSRVPTLKELAIMCRNAYDEEMFIQMERHVLSTLEWLLERVTLEDCLQLSIQLFMQPSVTPSRNFHQSSVSAATAVTRFLCELSLYHRDFLNYDTSIIAASANLLALSMLQVPQGLELLAEIRTLASTHVVNVEDRENIQPRIFGPFLTGFDLSTPNKLRKLALMLCTSLHQISDVLTTKYKGLGVIQVVHNFLDTHRQVFDSLAESKNQVFSMDEAEMENSHIGVIADILLNIHGPINEAPLTPPSTSRSIFSGQRTSPTDVSPTNTPTSKSHFPFKSPGVPI